VIPSNVIERGNNESNSTTSGSAGSRVLAAPARFPAALPERIKFLISTTVVDPFAAATPRSRWRGLRRRWLA
jgi:hypothetical protein